MSTTETAAPKAAEQPIKPSGSAAYAPISLAQYSQDYSISRNPFGVAAVLPLLVLSFIGLELGVLANNYWGWFSNINPLIGGFMFVSLGILGIPAIALRGSLKFDDKGVAFHRGKDSLDATWNQVKGLTVNKTHGLCLNVEGANMSKKKLHWPGGLKAESGTCTIPIRLFGDRKFAILYEIRDRLPEQSWLPALQDSGAAPTKRALMVYALVVSISVAAILSAYLVVRQ